MKLRKFQFIIKIASIFYRVGFYSGVRREFWNCAEKFSVFVGIFVKTEIWNLKDSWIDWHSIEYSHSLKQHFSAGGHKVPYRLPGYLKGATGENCVNGEHNMRLREKPVGWVGFKRGARLEGG